MTTQGPARRSRRRVLYAGACASVVLPILAGAAWPGTASAAAPKVIAGVTLSAAPLGVDAGVWDPILSASTSTTARARAMSLAVAGARTFADVQPLLKLAGIDQLRYSSGSVSDEYDWQNNVAISNCPTTATSQFFTLPSCVYSPALPFALLSADARALGAQTAVTVNYGSGTASMAAQWVTQAQAPGEAVNSWEIGNESYGCWEDNNALAGPPANYPNYVPDDLAVCPMNQPAGDAAGLQIMATSYAVNAGQFMTAMKGADPSAQLGVPWAFDATVGGAVVENNAIWNNTVLGTDGPDIGFVDAHWYPYTFGGDIDPATNHHTVQGVIQSVKTIPSEYAKIQAELNTYAPGAKVVVGETGVSFNPTNVPCIPAGALFAAGDVLSWLAAGAQSVNWWPLDTSANLGDTCVNADEGMFTNTGSPLTPYYGYLLASALAQPGARLSSLATSDPSDVLAFQAQLPGGRIADALINTNTSNRETVRTSTALTGNVSTESYSAGDQNASNSEIVTGATTASAVNSSITLPAESITILDEQPSAVILDRTSRAGTFIKAGTKVTLRGELALGGKPAPAGTPVEIFRQVSAGRGSAATLLARTTAGGAFRVTDLPPAWGIYTYFASYTSRVYQAASQAFLVHVTIARPSLKLALSAKSVKPGTKVLVTATLGAMHVNRTLVIYAQPKGGPRRVIKRASANSKGQVAVVFPVKANTTFTVTFAGDTWYTPATASAATVIKP